jgi:hypothetical protein
MASNSKNKDGITKLKKKDKDTILMDLKKRDKDINLAKINGLCFAASPLVLISCHLRHAYIIKIIKVVMVLMHFHI